MIHARPDYAPIQDPRGLIPADEPVFLLRGQDVSAIPAIQAWLDHHQEQMADEGGADLTIVEYVEAQIDRMRVWQHTRAGKIADLPTYPQPTPAQRFVVIARDTGMAPDEYLAADTLLGSITAICDTRRVAQQVVQALNTCPPAAETGYSEEPF